MDGRFLSEGGVDYQAVDQSFESLKLANEHFRQNGLSRRFANADATRLPFRDGTFNLVFLIGVLHHVPDTPAACREVARVVRTGAALGANLIMAIMIRIGRMATERIDKAASAGLVLGVAMIANLTPRRGLR
jgi:ubiquinone/menaquinone biosynthesis C-methylase UbiE